MLKTERHRSGYLQRSKAMFVYKRIVIVQHERGLYLKDRSIKKILASGVYHVFDPLGRVSVEVFNLTVPAFNHPYVDVLVSEQRVLCECYFRSSNSMK